MSEPKRTIDVTFELAASHTLAGALSDLEDVVGLRILHAEFQAYPDEDDCGCDD